MDWLPMGWRALGVVLWGILWFNLIQKGSQLYDVILHIDSGWGPKAHWWFEKFVSVHKIPEGTEILHCVLLVTFLKKSNMFLCVKELVTSSAGEMECNHQDIGGACWGNYFKNSFLLFMQASSSDITCTTHLPCHCRLSIKYSPAHGQNRWFQG